MREMGVTFDVAHDRPWGPRPWFCDLLPQIFTEEEWSLLAAGIDQRLRAFECFLADVYGKREILHEGKIPVQPVLGSPYYQRVATGLPRANNAFLHLSGLGVVRLPDGGFAVKHHYLSNASGISYMMQNRRALARVLPQAFVDYPVRSIADVPTAMLEMLRGVSEDRDPTVVLLSGGPGSPVYSEHSFLGRRMGIPVVQGGDLLVLNDRVYLKTVSGLEKVDVIYARISDQFLDPLALRRDSLLGVPGIVHCIRKGTVQLINSVGSQLADDRALLCFSSVIVRYYLAEHPILPTLDTYWLGDLDQREMVLERVNEFTIRPLYGEKLLAQTGNGDASEESGNDLIREVLANPGQYVAQPRDVDARTTCFEDGKPTARVQDHILFAQRSDAGGFRVFPGALTRVSTASTPHTANELGGGSKDTWVTGPGAEDAGYASPRRSMESVVPSHHVTSRVAEAFYWVGRYLERASSLAGMVSVVESLEMEELNATERMLYRPVWNRLLPPLETPGKGSRRSISTPLGRYRLALDPDEPDSVVAAVQRAAHNCESILECLSLDAWSVVDKLRSGLKRVGYRSDLPESQCARLTRRICEFVTQMVPQFFGVAQSTMVVDGGWRFCEIGRMVERAAITANAACSMMRSIPRIPPKRPSGEHAREIELSAFLRLLNTRDAYRRVYQMRTEPAPVLHLLWSNPSVPRSVRRCIDVCAHLLAESQPDSSLAMQRTAEFLRLLRDRIGSIHWEQYFDSESNPDPLRHEEMLSTLSSLLSELLEVHHLIADGFLNHQVHMRPPEQPLLPSFTDAV